MTNVPMEATLDPQSRIGQVCDRCREKKIKCDGAIPSCTNCATASTPCKVSATLRRKTKIRGFGSDRDDALVQKLQAENTELRMRLQAECQTSQALREELDRVSQQGSASRPRKLPRPLHPGSSQNTTSPSHPPSSDAGVSLPDKSMYVIKHMGRLVHDGAGVGRFAGSTTGVHFVLRVDEACVQSLGYAAHFPESSFRLHLLPSTEASSGIPGGVAPEGASPAHMDAGAREMQQSFIYSLDYYVHQIDTFIDRWECFCPILVRKDILQDVATLLHPTQGGSAGPEDDIDLPAMVILAMVLSINQLEDVELNQVADSNRRWLVASTHEMLNAVAAKGDIKSLQALIMCALHSQLTGQALQMLSLNGLMVRIAQSLGLHRHDRRFKFKSGTVELRRRIWWWIYAFDKIASVTNGLPELIKDVDVDNDMPVDCILGDLNVDALCHPLPGENTPVFLFNQYVLLCKKFSAILDQLYTTTQRRGGAEKIMRLDRDLRVWNHAFNALPHVVPFEVGEFLPRTFEDNGNEGNLLMNHWLQVLANIAMLQIHRPALTFDVNTPEFGTSFKVCLKSSSAILDLLEDKTFGWWLQKICPSGPAVVFQSALMHVYSHCSPSSIPSVGSGSRSASKSIIAKAVHLLRCYLPDETALKEPKNPDFRDQSIVQTMETLRSLQNALAQNSLYQMGRTSQGRVAPIISPQTVDMPQNMEPEAIAQVEAWNSNALEYLNNFDDVDWGWSGADLFQI